MRQRYYISIDNENIRKVSYNGNIDTVEVISSDSSFVSFSFKANRPIEQKEIIIQEGEEKFKISVFGKSEGFKGRVEVKIPKEKDFIISNGKFTCEYYHQHEGELIVYQDGSDEAIANYPGKLQRLHIGATIKARFSDRTEKIQI